MLPGRLANEDRDGPSSMNEVPSLHMPMDSPPPDSRWGRMERRIARAALEAGVSSGGVDLIRRAHRAAMTVRGSGEKALSSEDHPAYLHPGRVVLVLLTDLQATDPLLLATGALAESRDLDLRVEAETVRGVLVDEDAFDLWRALPSIDWRGGAGPDADGCLLEELVIAPPAVQRVAMAEALDQIRHAHLWESESDRLRAAALASEVFEPLAPRVHPTLERRLRWWVRRVGRGL